MTTFKAPSGAEVIIAAAPWVQAKALKSAIERALDLRGGIGFDTSADTFLASVLKVDSDPAVDAALWPCLIRCTRAGVKITEETFDDIEARKDYYDILTACIKENLNPLVESLFSKLLSAGIVRKQASAGQESKSPTTPSLSPSDLQKTDISGGTPPTS